MTEPNTIDASVRADLTASGQPTPVSAERSTPDELDAVSSEQAVPDETAEKAEKEEKAERLRKRRELRAEKRRKAIQQRRNKHGKLLSGVCIGLVVICAVGNLFTRDKSFSDAENRALQQRPALSVAALTSGSFLSEWIDHYSDQFFLRNSWISFNMHIDRLMGSHEENGVCFGKDGYLFSYPASAPAGEMETMQKAVTGFSAAYPDYAVRLLIIPSASQILTDKLPDNAPFSNQLTQLQALYSGMPEEVTCIDAGLTLQSHADEYIYYKTDHHWTSLGAYYTFSENAAALGISSPLSYESLPVTTEFEGTLASKCGSHSTTDTIRVYRPLHTDVEYYVYNPEKGTRVCSVYDSSKLQEKSKYNVFFGDNYPLLEIETTADNRKTLLVFKDSYANAFVPLLIPYYEKIIMIDPRYYYDDLGAYLNTAGVTDVLFLYSADNFLTDTSTADVLESALSVD